MRPHPNDLLNTEHLSPPEQLVSSYFFSDAFDPDSAFAFDSLFVPESLSFDPESFVESPLPSESDLDSDLDAPDDFLA